ncbi:thrombospondin [Micromonospora sp. NPDC049891]|uniref:thrombospondin n=1 Tax=Micromonospora sp. NPDC049891 TaxID=3155655 RepID=UPI0033E29F92
MRFPSLSRREEPAPPVDDDGRAGTVATDTRRGERPGVEGRTDGSTTGRAPADGSIATERTTDQTPTRQTAADRVAGRTDTDRAASSQTAGTDTDRADRQPDAQRSAEARAATARSTVHGSRRARAATTETVDGHRATGVDRVLDGDRTSDRTGNDLRTTDGDRTVDGLGTADHDRTGDGDRAGDTDRAVGRERIAGTRERDDSVDDDRTPDGEAGRDVPPAPVGPRPRASLLATLGLIVGVGGTLFVLTGILAGYGIALGAVGAVLAVLGLIATRRRHIAGKSDALLGIAFGLGAVVLGVLAMTGQYDWPTTDGDLVARFREWLDSQFVDRL